MQQMCEMCKSIQQKLKLQHAGNAYPCCIIPYLIDEATPNPETEYQRYQKCDHCLLLHHVIKLQRNQPAEPAPAIRIRC